MKPLVVLKIGGTAAEAGAGLRALTWEIAELHSDFRFVVIHGGGAELTKLSERLGIQPVFRDGVRITSPQEMELVDMVLGGAMNKRVVRALTAAGVKAVGLSGSDGPIFTGKPLRGKGSATRTGEIDLIDVTLLLQLSEGGYTPVMSSVCDDRAGVGLNINADTVALHLAPELGTVSLVFLSDIPGVVKNGAVLSALTPEAAAEEVAAGTIRGGMVPKVQAAVGALNAGVRQVIIGRHEGEGSLRSLLEARSGTTIAAHGAPAGGGSPSHKES